MISNSKSRKILGTEYRHLSNDETDNIKKQLYVVAFDLFEIWKKDKLGQKRKKVLSKI